jgi:hypothetical protein
VLGFGRAIRRDNGCDGGSFSGFSGSPV